MANPHSELPIKEVATLPKNNRTAIEIGSVYKSLCFTSSLLSVKAKMSEAQPMTIIPQAIRKRLAKRPEIVRYTPVLMPHKDKARQLPN